MSQPLWIRNLRQTRKGEMSTRNSGIDSGIGSEKRSALTHGCFAESLQWKLNNIHNLLHRTFLYIITRRESSRPLDRRLYNIINIFVAMTFVGGNNNSFKYFKLIYVIQKRFCSAFWKLGSIIKGIHVTLHQNLRSSFSEQELRWLDVCE